MTRSLAPPCCEAMLAFLPAQHQLGKEKGVRKPLERETRARQRVGNGSGGSTEKLLPLIDDDTFSFSPLPTTVSKMRAQMRPVTDAESMACGLDPAHQLLSVRATTIEQA